MKNLQSIFLAILVCFSFQGSFSKPVAKSSADLVARNFMARWGNPGDLKSGVKTNLVCKGFGYLQHTAGTPSESPAFYVFNSDNSGFIMVAGDDGVPPVLAYSRESHFDFDNMSSGLEALLHGYEEEINYVAKKNLSPSAEVKEEWNQYLNYSKELKSSAVIDSIKPMTTTQWGYGKPYNDLCPYDPMATIRNGRHAPAGCAAVAMAQLLKYWNHPVRGIGANAYELSKYGVLSANFGATTYDWKNMPDVVDTTSAEVRKKAVATLMYHCGISVNMTYDAGASSSFFNCEPDPYSGLNCVQKAFSKFFGFKNSVIAVPGSYSDSQWKEMIKKEIVSGRPVIYAGEDQGAGHALVIDGFDKSGRFSMNWGLFGFNNGFYFMNLVKLKASEELTYNFIYNSLILIGIEPDHSVNSEDPALNEPIRIWPNPASDVLNIDLSATMEDCKEIFILNSLGMNILNVSYTGTQVQIPLDKMAEGMYFIRFENQGRLTTKKFIVKK
jgi:hypothetical protein